MSSSVPIVLELEEIDKWYGSICSLHHVGLQLRRGEILGLLGDNGAGKSTLVKIIAGMIQPDNGVLRVEGKEVSFSSPGAARASGIETVYQDLALIMQLSVWRNLFLGEEIRHPWWRMKALCSTKMRCLSKGALDALGIQGIVSPEILVSNLSGGQRQAVAIARALFFGARILVLDEPTAALSEKTASEVYSAVCSARDKGSAVIIVSHNVGQVYEIADRFLVLGQGRVVGSVMKEEVSLAELLDRMFQWKGSRS